MHVGRLIHQTFGQQRVQAAFDIYNVRPLKVNTSFQQLEKQQPMAGVIQFYEGQNFFLNSAISSLGKVLLKKLLRACPDVDNTFELLRPNKGKERSEHAQNIISLPVITKESV